MFNLEHYLAIGVDAAVYFALASIATLLFLIKLALQFLGGGSDTGVDTGDLDAQMGSTAAFTLFSTLSVLCFFMGVGWMGLACRVSWGLGSTASSAIATVFGVALMFLCAGMMHGLRRMAHAPSYDVSSAIGSTVSVYLTIPPIGGGKGLVEVTVSGRRKVLEAVSTSDEIPSFSEAMVVAASHDQVLVVKPSSPVLPDST